jgi:uncharacterized surface protein with fasciclin (FAS1) repeats
MHRRTLLTAFGAGSLLLAGCGGGDDPPPLDIVQTAQATPEFSTLVQAVSAAGLAPTLQGVGPFTVFAPTNAAFAALLTELGVTLEQLVADQALLRSVLTYHVLPDLVAASQVPAGRAITTVQGGIFKIDPVNGGLRITDGRNRTATITATDIAARNGVIHRIDRVLLPADRNIVQLAQATPELSTLVAAVQAAGLGGTLSGTGPFTVLAPTNAAFAALLTELGISQATLLADVPLLQRVLGYHVLPQRVLRAEIPAGTPLATASTTAGDRLSISAAGVVTDALGRTANLAATDIFASNGVVHVIDRVLRPA